MGNKKLVIDTQSLEASSAFARCPQAFDELPPGLAQAIVENPIRACQEIAKAICKTTSKFGQMQSTINRRDYPPYVERGFRLTTGHDVCGEDVICGNGDVLTVNKHKVGLIQIDSSKNVGDAWRIFGRAGLNTILADFLFQHQQFIPFRWDVSMMTLIFGGSVFRDEHSPDNDPKLYLRCLIKTDTWNRSLISLEEACKAYHHLVIFQALI